MTTIISTDKAPAAVGPYSQATRKGNLLFISGQLGLDPATGELASGGVAGQAQQSLKNLQAILAAAGATVDDVLKTTVFLVDMADFATVNKIYSEVFKQNYPARSCVAVAALPKGGLVEVECIAVIG